ncbi:putative Cycline T [Monocercomonoides exilis]|uniref:putative Cycline T n=1 Tax=Monocercomonoides exilis TaxID=2049356 RepID=UPI00355ACB84|nr:putative Cycline T [Monocercomonoides exilis]|eukprot:MONOS_9311.1-p1 / transcript=MONOS_9311.1 / gene=MONOS_9311 / organism=Monocercomonoides_exilis_PA203 / gene_product=Cycline T / transcript_product=Cycline T / location=Mono_scaffold00379:47978-48950(-) / protein_length=271 / sequence_SO=supercontig / SO=protein_coding / is_pseudo=false
MSLDSSHNYMSHFICAENTPSFKDGIPEEIEISMRYRSCMMIQALSKCLSLPSSPTQTACYFLHKFYMKHSFKKYDNEVVILTCLFFAAKCEENPKHLRTIIRAYDLVKNGVRTDTLDEKSPQFLNIRQQVFDCERLLMNTLDFDFWVDQPDYYLTTFLGRVNASIDFANTAWAVVRDIFLSPLCIIFSAETIAVAAIIVSSVLLELESDALTMIVKGCTDGEKKVKQASYAFLDFYSTFLEVKGEEDGELSHKLILTECIPISNECRILY